MPHVTWAIARNNYQAGNVANQLWSSGGRPRWAEFVMAQSHLDRHFRCGACRADRCVSEARFQRTVAEKGLPLSCHMIGEVCSATKRTVPIAST